MNRSELRVRDILAGSGKSRLRKYQDVVVGKRDLLALVKYELIVTLCSWVPGALGLLLRSKLYPLLLGGTGRNVVFGANVVLRHPHRIFVGSDVVIDDNCLVDAKGVGENGIFIGDRVFIGRNTILSCKGGDIRLEDGVNIGFNCEIYSSSTVTLRENVLVAAYCYLVGGGNYDLETPEIPSVQQDGYVSRGGIEIEKNVWIGARVTILDGVTVGRDAVIGAGAVVPDSIPPSSVAVGVPARVRRSRQQLSCWAHSAKGTGPQDVEAKD